jgi:hypothetical protein
MSKIRIDVDGNLMKALVVGHFQSVLNLPLEEKDVTIEVKATQNYRSEWETGAFRAYVEKQID